jgi:hypothetical protein
MLQMDLPTINVLTKIDNLINYPPLLFNLDFYTEVHELKYLLPHLEAERTGEPIAELQETDFDAIEDDEEEKDTPPSKFAALNTAITSLIEDFALVGFEPLAVEDRTSMTTLLHAIDRAGGYAFGSELGANDTVWQVAMREGATTIDVRDVQERWIDRREEYDALEREGWKAEGERERRKGEPDGPDGEGMDIDDDEFGGLSKRAGLERGMMGRDSGISIVRKKPPAVVVEEKNQGPTL